MTGVQVRYGDSSVSGTQGHAHRPRCSAILGGLLPPRGPRRHLTTTVLPVRRKRGLVSRLHSFHPNPTWQEEGYISLQGHKNCHCSSWLLRTSGCLITGTRTKAVWDSWRLSSINSPELPSLTERRLLPSTAHPFAVIEKTPSDIIRYSTCNRRLSLITQ